MKKTYNVVGRQRSWLQLLIVWILMLSPSIGFAQTFTETSGTTATEGQSVDSYEANLGFDNDNERGFTYTAAGDVSPVLSTTDNSPSSGGPNVQFAPSTNTSSFAVGSISTAGITSPTLTFALSAPTGTLGTNVAAGNNRFRVQIGVGSVSTTGVVTYLYVNAAYTFTRTSGTWGNATVTLPSNTSGNALIAIRFQRIIGGNTNNELYRIDNITLGGTSTGVLTAQPNALDFGDVSVGSNSVAQVIRVSGQELLGNVTLTAPAGYQIRVFGTGGYGSSLTLASNNGVVPSTRIQVRFVPAASGVSNGTLVVSSAGVTSAEVDLTGNGIVPIITANPTSLAFGNIFVGQTSAPIDLTVSGTNVANNVTVTAPTGFQVRRTSTDAYTSSVVLTATEVTTGFTLQAAFRPATAGSYASSISVTTPGTSTSVSVTGTATATPTGPFIVANPTDLDFGTVSANGSAQILSFSINAGNLIAPLTLTGSAANIAFRDATSGGSFTAGPIVIQPNGGTVSVRTIEVRLVAPVAGGPFTGNITASSDNAASVVVNITANSTGNQPVINTSGTINQFSTVPGVPSSPQSYLLSGTNLLQGITVSAPQFYQVSLDINFTGITTTGNIIVVPRDNGNDVVEKPVYVRFFPPSALAASSNAIINTSTPAQGRSVSVSGTSEPLIAIDNAFQEVFLQIVNTKSTAQLLNIRAERVRQPINITKTVSDNTFNPSRTPQFELSLDGITYSAQVTLTPNATTFSVNQPLYVRYIPTYLGNAQSTLQFQSNDFSDVRVRPIGVNDLLAGNSIDTQPTLRSTATVVRSGSTATVSFNLPSDFEEQGYGEGRIIIASTNPELPGNQQPTDGRSYQTGNQRFGLGDEVSTGYFVVYAGPNRSVVVENLNPGTTYYFYVFEYNNVDESNNVSVNNAENYLNPAQPNTIPGIIAPSPLPVTLVSFSAKARGNQVVLNWVTASELNNKGFEVQRSRDGRSFETILTRDGKGTTNATTTYNEVDRKPVNGLAYYRLKQVDLDGSSSFSATVTVNFLNSGEVTMYPNPVQDQLTIDIAGSAEGVTAVITDMTGRLISTLKIGTDSKLDMTNLQAGTYLVTVGEGDAKVTRRIVKK